MNHYWFSKKIGRNDAYGHAANADDVGALNILARGHRVLACGVGLLEPSMKQEPVGSSDTNLLVG